MAGVSSFHLRSAASRGDLLLVREALAAAGYTAEGVIRLLGFLQPPQPRNLPRLLRLTSGGTKLETLVRLLLFGVPVDLPAANDAMGALPLATLEQAGLLRVQDGEVRAEAVVLPYQDLLIVADHPAKIASGAPSDLVMGITESTLDLDHYTIRRPSRATLDLGTGCGVQALRAAAHSGLVYATDYGPRCLEFASFNAALNGIDNLEFRLGSGFDPVRGQSFDLIVANLPFVITPGRRYVYRDSGMPLDSFSEQVVREAASALEEGGYAQILCQWAHLAGQDWQGRVSGWLAGSGCDAWVLRHYTDPPDRYAEQWIAGTEPGDLETGRRLFQEWMAYYERENVEAITTGLIVMRRRPGASNWLRIEDLPPKEPELYGDALERGFALRDFVECPDEEMLATPLRVSPAARLASESEWSQAGWRVVEARLRKTRGLRYQGKLDSHVLQLVNGCDGTRTPRELLQQMAASLHVDFERVAGAALPLIRQLIERDVLLPPSFPDQG